MWCSFRLKCCFSANLDFWKLDKFGIWTKFFTFHKSIFPIFSFFFINVEPLISECIEKRKKKEKRKQILKKKLFKLPIDYLSFFSCHYKIRLTKWRLLLIYNLLCRYQRWTLSSSSSALIPPERETYALSYPGIIFFSESASLGKLMFFSCNSFVTCRLRWEGQQMRNKISFESGLSSGRK